MEIRLLTILKRAIVIMAPFVFIACEKPNEQLGLDQVIGANAKVADTTLDVISYTENVDSILVALAYDDQLQLGGYGGNRLVGSYVDPDFGRAEASVVAQVLLNTVNIDFGTNPVVDSVSLFMRYTGSYGDTSRPMEFEVFQLGRELSRDSLYFSDYEPGLGQKISLSNSIRPRPNTSGRIDGEVTPPVLRIPLDKNFFQENFANVGDGNFPAFSSNEEFINYFKGIYVQTPTEDASIPYFDLSSPNSAIRIYYHNAEDTLQVNLNFSQESDVVPIHFSVFDQDYSSYPTGFDLSSIDSTNGEQQTYVQAMGGVATVVEIPGLAELAKDDLLINQAFLEIRKASGTGSGLAPPPRLEMREFTGRVPGAVIDDFRLRQNIEGDGVFRSEEFRQGYYRFNLTRYIFDVVNGGEDLKLAVVPLSKSTVAHRVILEGGQKSANDLKLKIYYTKP